MAENSEKSKRRGRPENIVPYQFKPGQSGNPGGRPKRLIDGALKELLEAGDSEAAMAIAKALVQRALKDSKSAQLIAERTEGKPKQKVEITGEDGGAIAVSVTFKDANG